MKILALESSAVSASVALTEDEKLVAQSFQNCGLTHSRTLLPMVENLLANCGVSLADVDAIAVAHGPGSFTGVRIGVATVKGLALGADKPCLGVSTLEAMAWGARALGGDLCCVMDARAGQVYNALFTVEDGKVRRLCDDRAIKLTELAERIRPYVADTDAYMMQAVREGKKILLEGQLGTLRDPDHGIYPMVTSSSPLAGYGPVGAGVPVWSIKEVIAVTKAYSSCVGAGPFTTELFGDEAEELRKRGGDRGEYGATTGRPRRVGWFDCVATRYGCEMQGATAVAMTNLDVLGYLDEIPVCVAYELNGERVDHFPVTPKLEQCKPIYVKLPGWKCDTRGIKNFDELPENARHYIEFLEKEVGCPFKLISNGPRRDEIIYR